MKEQNWKYPNIENPYDHVLSKHRFVPRCSLLDDYHKDSKLSNSEFRGVFNLLVILALFFLVVRPMNNHFERGLYFSRALYDNIRNQLFVCFLIWPLFSLWSLSAFILEKLHVMGYNKSMLRFLKHASQGAVFLFGIVVIMKKKWPATHNTFVILQMCVHFMKMHSYTNTNRDYRHQAKEAIQKGQKPLTSYPANVNMKNFAHYMIIPVLVYDYQYPLKANRDYFYIGKTLLSVCICILACYLLETDYIIPFVQMGKRISFYELLSRSILPVTLILVLIFYIVFECVCNFFGEISLFADRGFYKQWWNSTTFEEFNRLWNQPVHEFLLRHVYLELIMRFRTSKSRAQFFTFLFSAILHELLFAVIFKVVRPILFAFMLGQIPLFWLTKRMKDTKMGNYFFWFGLTLGPPLIICLYLRVDDRVTSFYEIPELK